MYVITITYNLENKKATIHHTNTAFRFYGMKVDNEKFSLHWTSATEKGKRCPIWNNFKINKIYLSPNMLKRFSEHSVCIHESKNSTGGIPTSDTLWKAQSCYWDKIYWALFKGYAFFILKCNLTCTVEVWIIQTNNKYKVLCYNIRTIGSIKWYFIQYHQCYDST